MGADSPAKPGDAKQEECTSNASDDEPDMGTMSRIGWAAMTAIPITLMVLGGCVSYAQLLIQNTPLDINVIVATFNFSIGISMFTKNYASYCAYTMSSADMTLQLFLKQVLAGVAAAGLSERETTATMWAALHIGSFFIGALFVVLGKVKAAVALSYLPYPVVAGFLAMIGGSIVKGGITLLYPKVGESVMPLILGIGLAASSTVAKSAGIPSNLSSVLAIVVSIVGFWAWVYLTGKDSDFLRTKGWLFPQRAEPVPPMTIWTGVEWDQVNWAYAFPDIGSLMLAMVACINRALTITGIEAAVGDNSYSIDEEMFSTGIASCAAGTVGGVIMNPTSGMSSLCCEGCEGDTRMARYSVIMSSGVFVAIWASGVPLTNYLPRFMLGGLLMMMGVGMLVDWAWLVRQRIQWQSQCIIYGMLAFSLQYDLISGVVLGLGIALVISNTHFANLEVLKYHVSGSHFRSPVDYEHKQRECLATHGDRTQIIGLTGYLFEGVAICVSKYLREVVRSYKDLDTLVLDFFAVQGMNDSACAHLVKVSRLCETEGVSLIFVNLHGDDEDLLMSWGDLKCADSMSTTLAEAEESILEIFKVPCPLVQEQSPDGKTEHHSLEVWLGHDAAMELMQVGKLRSIKKGICLTDARAKENQGVIVAIPEHSEVQVEVKTGNKHRPATLSRTMQGAVCGSEILIGQRARGTWRTMCDSVVLQLPAAADWRAMYPTAFAALLSASFEQHVHQLDHLSSLYTVNRGGGWQGVTFDGITQVGGATEIQKLGKSAARPSSRMSAQQSKPQTMGEDASGEHLVAAVLMRTRSPGPRCLHPIAEAEEKMHKPDSTEEKYMLLNRDSVGEGLNQLKAFVPRKKLGQQKPPSSLMDLFADNKVAPMMSGDKSEPLLPVVAPTTSGPRLRVGSESPPGVGKRRVSKRVGNALMTNEVHPNDDFRPSALKGSVVNRAKRAGSSVM